MSRKKLLERKKKNRKKTSKERVLKRRAEARALKKYMEEIEAKEKLIGKMERLYPKQMEAYKKEDLMKVPLDSLKKIEDNIRVLKNLEDEYNREVESRNRINEELEQQGYLTAEQKLEALSSDQAKELMENEMKKVGVSGSADCSFQVNEPKKDTADVEVVKAPQED